MRAVVFVLVAVVVAGCQGRKPAASYVPAPVRLQPIGTVAPFPGDVKCVYYKDWDTGDFYRVSLDGTVRERVLKGDKADTVRLSVDPFMDKSNWRLNVGGIPGGGGYAVLDKHPPTTFREPFRETTTSEPAHYAFSDARCEWTVTFHRRPHEIEPGHVHHVWNKVEFSRAGRRVVYDFAWEAPIMDNVWLIDDGHAVVFDHPNVLIWDFASDSQTCIAHGSMAELWPRDLRKKERFQPLLHGKGKSWAARTPDDVDWSDH